MTDGVSLPETRPHRPLAHEPLIGRGVARALVTALVVSALGLGAGALAAPEVAGVLRTSGILIAAIALVLLFGRRGEDRLEAIPARSAIVIAIAAGLAAIGVIWLLNNGPDRPIGIVGTVAAIGFVTAAAAAAASTAVLIRPHVEPMVAHVWAGIAGAGFAIPFMAAGAAPELIMAGAVLVGLADRAGHRRRARALVARERALAGETVDGADPRDAQRLSDRGPAWSREERRLALILGCTAIGTVVVAWAIGIAVGSGGDLASAATGQGFAAASLAAIPLAVQAALLRGALAPLRGWLAVGGGMLGLASLVLLAVPADAVFLAAIAAQSVAVALLAGSHVRLARAASTETAVLVAIVAATAWWLVIVSTGGLLLAFIAVVTTLVALRRRPRRERPARPAGVGSPR